MAAHTIFNSESDEDHWVVQIDHLVNQTNLTILNQMPACIFQVPKSLSCSKPEAFTPQLVAIGPYNHFRPELYPMERFKVFAAKRILDYFNKHDLKLLVEQLGDIEHFIRACYHKYLDLKEKTLLYALAIDSMFLLELFHSYLDERESSSFLKGLDQQVQRSGMKLTKDAIIRDVFMVENQIPTFALLRILQIERSKPVGSVQEQEDLGLMLLSFCEKHSPIKFTHTPTYSEVVAKHYHILDLMYHLVVSQHGKSETLTLFETEGNNTNINSTIVATTYTSDGIINFFKKVKGSLKMLVGALKKLKDMDIPVLQPIKKHLDPILNASSNLEYLSSSETPPSETEPPVVLNIPSVCELHSVEIKFRPSKGGIMGIEFDPEKGIFYLPVLKLDVNSEVIMRNLVAYEALTKPDSLIFTRYTELMRGIIDTVEDVKVLKDENIIESSSSLSVEETEELFNGMSKSIGPTKTEKLDETIKKVNKYFHDKRKANFYKILTEYVYSSWKLFTLLATLVLLGMTALQTFCTVYDCPSHFKSK